MTPIVTKRLLLRLWEDRDRLVFHRLSSDERVMRFFPFRRTREESDAEMDLCNANAARDGFTFFAVETRDEPVVVGMAGLGPVAADLPFAPAIQIGWRLVPEATGCGYATEAALACCDLAFGKADLDEIVSMCASENHASEAIMCRLKMVSDGLFDHPAVDAATHPHLVRHKLYRLSRSAWHSGI